MSNAIAQSATALAVSSPKDIDVKALVVKNATRSVKGVTRERLMLNQNKLMQAVRIEYKSLMGMNTKADRLPDEVENMLQSTVNDYIMANVNRINPSNCIGFTTRDRHDFRNLSVVERITATGENKLALQAQLEGVNRLIRANNEKIERLEKQDANGNSHVAGDIIQEQLKNARVESAQLNLTKTHIVASIEQISKVAPK